MDDILKGIATDIANGKFADALFKLMDSKVLLKQDFETYFKAIGLVIDCAANLGDVKMLSDGISEYQRIEEFVDDPVKKAELNFNVGIGSLHLFEIERSEGDNMPLPDNKHLKLAKLSFRNALACEQDIGSDLLARIYVSYGNCLNYLGRSLEALEAYESALLIKPDMGFAKGNKAMTLFGMLNISGRHRDQFLRESKEMIEEALNDSSLKSVGTAASVNIFKQYQEAIEEEILNPGSHFYLARLPEKFSYDPNEDTKRTELQQFFDDFCGENQLFLNLCIYCRRCKISQTDPLVVSLANERKDASKFTTYVNQIKEDYATARMLLVESQFDGKELESLSRVTTYLDVGNDILGIRSGYLKMSLEKSFNILDKVALLLRDHFKLPIKVKKAFYLSRDLWQEKYEWGDGMRSQFDDADNPNLYALYDIYCDLAADPYLKKVRALRNFITHYYVTIEDTDKWIDRKKEGIYYISQDSLIIEATNTLKLARAVVIYLLSFLAVEENKRVELSE